LLLLIAVLLLAAPLAAQEEATLPYATTILPTGDDGLDSALTDASQLRALAEPAPVDAFGLVARAQAEPRRLEEVLRSRGWWAPRVEVLLDGQPADTPGLAERLAATRGTEVRVEVRVVPGPRYVLRRIATRAATPAAAAEVAAIGPPPDLAPGQPAAADPVLDAESALLDRMRRDGFPLAAVADREVVVDHENQTMDVTWTLVPGPQAAFARPEVEGDSRVNPQLVDRVAGRLEGQTYSPQRLERVRRDVVALGAFDSVRVRAGDRLDAAGRLPVTFSVTDRPRNAAGFSVAYETEFGFAGRVYYERRNVFGNGETWRVEADISRLGEGGWENVNYRLGTSFRRPGLFDGRTAVVADVALVRERLEAYDRDAFVASVLAEYRLGERWVLRAGPTFETGTIGLDTDSMDPFTLLGLVTAARYDDTDSLLDPRRGYRLDLNATPYREFQSGGNFIRALGVGRTYLDVTGDGGSVIALRGALGSVFGSTANVPLDKRFYAGGGGSVRGYTFQSIGPRDAQNRPTGGFSLVEGSVELRQRITGPFGVVAFLDAGSVGPTDAPDFGALQFGAGLGLRYATAIGPLRVDVGVPLSREPGDAAYAFYVGLGQAF
jgi:translocation and assembly module TamA